MPARVTLAAITFLAGVPGLVILAVGVHGVVTGHYSGHGRGSSFVTVVNGPLGSVLSLYLVIGGLAWLRAAWLVTHGQNWRGDGPLRALLFLLATSMAAALAALFLSVAF